MTRFISIVSGKGGTGKTTIAIELAVALKKRGYNVAIIDSNLETPNVSIHLGNPMLEYTLNDVLQGKKRINDVTYKHPTGIYIVPSSITLESEKKPEILQDAIFTLEGLFDFVLIDSPSGIEKAKYSIISSDEAIIITNPELPSVIEAMKMVKLTKELGIKVEGTIINKVRMDETEMLIDNIKEMINSDILGIIPEDDTVKKAFKFRSSASYLYPESDISKSINEIVEKIINKA